MKIVRFNSFEDLHGSLRPHTVQELIGDYNFQDLPNLDTVFAQFRRLHTVVNTKEILTRCVKEVCDDFIAENCLWVEIRTSPRASDGFTKEEYINTILRAMEQKQASSQTQFRLILSIDRYRPLSEAQETIDLARKFTFSNRPNVPRVVGIDLSGDPNSKDFRDFEPYLNIARRQLSLFTTIHLGEVPNHDETKEIVQDFRPDRVGHALHLHSSLENLVGRTCAIESCPTSNLHTLKLESLQEHPFLEQWVKEDRRIAICTDDRGVFRTSLSQELDLVNKHFGGDPVDLTLKAAKEVFGIESEKFELLRQLSDALPMKFDNANL